MNYLQFTLTSDGVFEFYLEVKSAAGQSNWGFIDNIVLANEHFGPEPEEPDTENILLDGGFELVGASSFDTSEAWDRTVVQELDTFILWTVGDWQNSGKYSLKFNYWPEVVTGYVDGSITQTFTITEAGDYSLAFYLAAGGLTQSTVVVYDSLENEIVKEVLTNNGSFTDYENNDLVLVPGEYTLEFRFYENGQSWANVDDVSLTKILTE